MSKPLIIGQAPARGNDDKPPFAGRSGARLATLAGLGETGDVLPDTFELINLNEKYPGKNQAPGWRGDDFDPKEAAIRAREILYELEWQHHRWVLLMGRKVRRAMGVGNHEYLEVFRIFHHHAVVFPHPSGLNRWWNDPDNAEKAEDFLRRVAHGKTKELRAAATRSQH